MSENEKETLKSLCSNFGALFPAYFPKSTFTRKIHELVFHELRFIDEHGTVGLFSEEEKESLHHQSLQVYIVSCSIVLCHE